MNIRAGLGENILQTRSTNFFEDSIGGVNPPPPNLSLWVRQWPILFPIKRRNVKYRLGISSK